MRLLLFLVAVIALLLQPQSVVEAKATAAFLRSATTHKLPLAVTYRLPIVRGGGGAATDSDDESESTSDDDDEESESEPEQPIKSAKVDAKASSTLTTSALQKLAKNDKKATTEKLAASKQAVNVKISAANKKKNSVFKGFWLRVPYIVRASMNPVTAYRMTVAYWASLVNLDYGKQDASQELRSALETKARMGGGTAKPKGRRTMKRGQARTIHDLPKLNS